MNATQYQRTIRATPTDTLDAIAYRVYAHRSIDMLPKIIESNIYYSPFALLPAQAIITLPDDNAIAATPSVKMWD